MKLGVIYKKWRSLFKRSMLLSTPKTVYTAGVPLSMYDQTRDIEEAGADVPAGAPADAPADAPVDTGAVGATSDSQAHTLNEILLGVIAIGDICSRMQESLSKVARPVAEARDADQELVSAAAALCSFRAASVTPALPFGAVPAVCAAPTASEAPALPFGAVPAVCAAPTAPAALVPPAALSARGARPRWRLRSDVGRRVSVMWVRPGFPPDTEPSARDLMAFYGVVEKHLRTRKSGTHLVLYDDGQRRWHKKDGLFAFL